MNGGATRALGCVVALSCVWLIAVGAVPAHQPTSGPSPTGANGLEMLQQLRRFYIVYAYMPDRDLDERNELEVSAIEKLAKPMLERLDHEIAIDPSLAEPLKLYIAQCAYMTGDSKRASDLASQIIQTPSDVNAPEAVRLLARIKEDTAVEVSKRLIALDIQDASRPNFQQEIQQWHFECIARLYPNGVIADFFSFHPREKPSSVPARDSSAMMRAGQLYVGMGMYEDAIDAYRTAAGFSEEYDWVSPDVGPVWLAMGGCYEQLGNWKAALSCYYKTVASGGAFQAGSRKIGEMRENIKKQKVSAIPKPQPNIESLERIARLCEGTEVFDGAMVAAESANRMRSIAVPDLVDEIHIAKARVLRRTLHDNGPNRVFRRTATGTHLVK